MEKLPNGVVVFNGTPHPIIFWDESWPDTVSVESDATINAEVIERPVVHNRNVHSGARWETVHVEFAGTPDSAEIIRQAYNAHADVIVGSIIAAQAYPGLVAAMVPCEGYERVPPAEKRMRPDKFTVYGG